MLDNNKIKVKSVKKTIDVLNAFLTREDMGVTEVAELVGLSKSNACDILTTLVAMDFLGQDADTEKYYLSVGAIRLARGVGHRYSFRNIARPFLQDIANIEGHETSLTVPLNGEIFYLDSVLPNKRGIYAPKRMRSFTCRMHCTAAGKCMLANMPREDVLRYLASGLERYTDNTITSDAELLSVLDAVARDGYATDHFEWSDSYGCVGVPLFDSEHKLIGALSMNLASGVEDEETVMRVKGELAEISAKITELMSGSGE